MEEFEIEQQLLKIRDKLFRMACAIMLNTEEALDITQDALTNILEIKDQLQGVKNFESYSIKTVRNLCFDRIRRKKKYAGEVLENGTGERVVYQNYEDREALHLLYKSLEELTPNHRLIFEMKTIEGYEYEEISQITGLTVENLRVIISRTRKKLKNNLNRQYGSYKRNTGQVL